MPKADEALSLQLSQTLSSGRTGTPSIVACGENPPCLKQKCHLQAAQSSAWVEISQLIFQRNLALRGFHIKDGCQG